MSKWREELEGWLKTIDVNCGSVLDVGGSEKPIRGRTKTWSTVAYGNLDIENGYDLDDPELILKAQPADVVFCLETLMYTTDPLTAVKNLARLTKKHLYLSNPLEGYPETKPAGTDMLRLFPNWYRQVFPSVGLDIQSLEIVEPSTPGHFSRAIVAEGYKAFRRHSSGILIHATKV